jgi:uncharacterized YigZ family protein
MKDVYRTIKGYGEDEIIINKSRFIGYSLPVNSEEDALQFIDEIKSKHRDATHNVYAYVLGEESNIQRFSDDGEPSGTAGIPVLEVIKKEDLRNLVVVVTRYFGGIKLGGGGLIRAYTKGAKIALEAGRIVEMTLHTKIKLIIPYTLLGKIENFLISNGLTVEESIYNENVEIILYIIKSKVDEFEKEMMNLTNGTVKFNYFEEEYLPLIDGKRV